MKILLCLFTTISFSLFAATAQIPVSGMTCTSCASAITKSLVRGDFQDVKVDVEKKMVTVIIPEKKLFSKMELDEMGTKMKVLIKEAGYQASDVTWTK